MAIIYLNSKFYWVKQTFDHELNYIFAVLRVFLIVKFSCFQFVFQISPSLRVRLDVTERHLAAVVLQRGGRFLEEISSLTLSIDEFQTPDRLPTVRNNRTRSQVFSTDVSHLTVDNTDPTASSSSIAYVYDDGATYVSNSSTPLRNRYV